MDVCTCMTHKCIVVNICPMGRSLPFGCPPALVLNVVYNNWLSDGAVAAGSATV